MSQRSTACLLAEVGPDLRHGCIEIQAALVLGAEHCEGHQSLGDAEGVDESACQSASVSGSMTPPHRSTTHSVTSVYAHRRADLAVVGEVALKLRSHRLKAWCHKARGALSTASPTSSHTVSHREARAPAVSGGCPCDFADVDRETLRRAEEMAYAPSTKRW